MTDRVPAALDDLPIGVLVLGPDGVSRVNDGWVALTGLSEAESRGRGWLDAVHPDDRRAAESALHSAASDDGATGDWRVLRRNGRGHVSELWVHARVRHARTSTDARCVVTLTEISSHKTTELHLLHLATHDPLTGLPNRAAFLQRCRDALVASPAGVTAVLFVDLDGFKVVNDRRGHLCGDKVLCAVARRLRAALRPFDLVGRLGGDEFAILARDVGSLRDVTRLADRIVSALDEPFTIDGEVMTIGASVGVALATPDASPEDLLADADGWMYRAKSSGGARWAMRGLHPRDVEVQRELEPGEAGVARLASEIVRLHERAVELCEQIDRIDDPALRRWATDICSALRRACDAAADPAVR